MYQASNGHQRTTTISSSQKHTTNFIDQINDDQQQQQPSQYEHFNENDSSTTNTYQPPVNNQTGGSNLRERLYEDDEDSISFALEEIGAVLGGKDFLDLEQKQTGQQQQQQYHQQRYLVSNNNLINNYNNHPQIKQQSTLEEAKVASLLFDARSELPQQAGEVTYKVEQGLCPNYTFQNNNNNMNLENQDYYIMDDRTSARPYVEIVEQPAKCALRFRYKCEGRSAGSLPGVNSTADNKTYPSIRINNYVGRAVVVISCVTRDPPYKSHPHNIVGKEGCKKGICTIVIQNQENMVRSFASLGIQCVKRKDIDESLSLRESIKVDPFRNGFDHKLDGSNIDLNVVRLCFQVFITGSSPNKCDVPLTPVVSEPIHDKKAMSDLVITKLSHCSAPATGGREVILLCDRISKDDIQIRFYEEREGKVVWETLTDLSPTEVHKQVAICFKTPKYHNENITQPVMCRIQLRRISDNQVSEPRMFQFLPCESDEDIISRKRRKIELFDMNHFALDNILQSSHLQQQHHHLHQIPLLTAANQNKSPQMDQHPQHPHPQQRPLPPPPPTPLMHDQHQQQQQQNAQCMIAIASQLPERSPEGRLTPLQARRASPIMGDQQQQQQRREYQLAPGSNRPPTRSPQPPPSPTQQQQQQQLHQQQHQNDYMIDTQNLVVRREIIDNEGRVMRLVDRPAIAEPQNIETSNVTTNVTNRPLDSSLDRIHISELMPDMTFNQNLDLNLGLGLSMHLNGTGGPNS